MYQSCMRKVNDCIHSCSYFAGYDEHSFMQMYLLLLLIFHLNYYKCIFYEGILILCKLLHGGHMSASRKLWPPSFDISNNSAHHLTILPACIRNSTSRAFIYYCHSTQVYCITVQFISCYFCIPVGCVQQ